MSTISEETLKKLRIDHCKHPREHRLYFVVSDRCPCWNKLSGSDKAVALGIVDEKNALGVYRSSVGFARDTMWGANI